MAKTSAFKISLIILNCIIVLALLAVSGALILFSTGYSFDSYSFYLTDNTVISEDFDENCFIIVQKSSGYTIGDDVVYAIETPLGLNSTTVEFYISKIHKIKGDTVYVQNKSNVTELSFDNIIGKVSFSYYLPEYMVTFLESSALKQIAVFAVIAFFVILDAFVIMFHSISRLRKAKKELLKEENEPQNIEVNDLIEIEEDVLLFRQNKE